MDLLFATAAPIAVARVATRLRILPSSQGIKRSVPTVSDVGIAKGRLRIYVMLGLHKVSFVWLATSP